MKPSVESVGSGRWRSPRTLWDKLKPLARDYRHAPTEAEERFWRVLRRAQLDGFHFRRQHAIDRFIVDLYYAEASFVIEVDGSIHDDQVEQDEARDELIKRIGLNVIRIRNAEILSDTSSVIKRIREALANARNARTSPSLSTERGTEGERSS